MSPQSMVRGVSGSSKEAACAGSLASGGARDDSARERSSKMRFRLSRSLTFWLGLPVLVFLLWAWADSFDWESRASLRKSGAICSVVSDGSSITFEWIRKEPTASSGTGEYEPPEIASTTGFDFYRTASARPKRPLLYAKLGTSTADFGGLRESALHVPYWMTVIAYVVLWFGLMAWRWMRGRRPPRVDTPGVRAQGEETPVSPTR